MIQAPPRRPIFWLFVVVFTAAGVARGQADGDESEQSDGSSVASKAAVNAPNLDDLKRLGAARSSYLQERNSPLVNAVPVANLDAFKERIRPIFEGACVHCHGPDSQEGNIRIDTLDPDLLHGNDVNWWIEVQAVISKGEMPPADEPELEDGERSQVIEWLSNELQVASTVRRAERGHSSFRRLTKYEYNYALQDLLGLPLDFAGDLPPESTSEDGFENSSEMLNMSAIRFAYYRELSHKALRRATVNGDMPSPLYWGISMQQASAEDWEKQDKQLEEIKQKHADDPEKLQAELDRQLKEYRARPGQTYYKNSPLDRTARATWSYPGAKYAFLPSESQPEIPPPSDIVAIIPPRQKLIVELGDRLPDEGNLRVRVRACRTSIDIDYVPSLQLELGWQASNDSHASVRISKRDMPIDAVPNQPQFYQWDIPISEVYPRNSVRHINRMGDLPSPSEYIKFVNSSLSPGDIQIDYVEVISPVNDQWPPESHTQIFFPSDNRGDEKLYARELLEKFIPRAWRRTIAPEEVDQKLKLFDSIRDECDTFEDAIIEVLATVLSSPQFLYIVSSESTTLVDSQVTSERNHRLDIELATRLSMFLWCSIPDDELLQLASEGKLSDPEVLSGQVQRMLLDQRSARFSNHFVRQWLDMQLLEFLNVDKKVYPQFDPALKEAMLEEPVAFFDSVLKNNNSVLDFIHADYTFVNERLGKHYGLKDVEGNDFRRVSLDPHNRRGGLLTQAGLLAMNSDGKDSHPLKRGIWMLESLLNDPPPPPPAAVPVIDLTDPEISKMTLKQRIENHRNQAACYSCHAKIDPWGIAFENFDAVGGWRDEIQGKPVDAASLLFNKQELNGVDGLKRYLLEYRQDQFARAMVFKIATYAVGHPLTFSDRSQIESITAELRKQGDGLGTLVRLIVLSDLFR